MVEFIKPWRRKLGVVTLVIALLLVGGWMRSHIICDSLPFGDRNSIQYVASSEGDLSWEKVTPIAVNSPTKKIPVNLRSVIFNHDITRVPRFGIEDSWQSWYGHCNWRKDWCGFKFGSASLWLELRKNEKLPFPSQYMKIDFWRVSYWNLIVPLAFVSAYLLLSKPRKSIPSKTDEPTPVEGT